MKKDCIDKVSIWLEDNLLVSGAVQVKENGDNSISTQLEISHYFKNKDNNKSLICSVSCGPYKTSSEAVAVTTICMND